MTLNRQGIWTSYLIGAPIGLFTIVVTFFMPLILTGEGLATMAMIALYGKAILGLIFSFLIALGIAGHRAGKDIENKKSLLKTSFIYSLTVNSIIWVVFSFLTTIENFQQEIWLYFAAPIIAFFACTIITTFTLGLLICYVIRKKIS